MLDSLRFDAAFALRGFRRHPLFTVMVVVIFALGIGANAIMFGVLDRLLLQAPEHISDPDRVVLFHIRNRGATWLQTSQPYAALAMLRREVSDFSDVAVATPTGVVRRTYYPIGSGETAARVAGALVSGNYFSVLGVRPALGRFFREDEEAEADAQKLVVIGYAYWQRQYAGRRDVIGQTIDIGVSRFTIVGIAPAGFTGTEMRDVDVWLPVTAADGLRFVKEPDWTTSTQSQWLLVIARLKSGVAVQRAEAEATAAYRAWARAQMTNPTAARLARVDSQAVILGSIIPGKSLWTWTLAGSGSDIRVSELLSAVSVLVLLIACANVANLLLVRALGRRREIAVRLALGVSRRRLIAQLVVEGMLLALIGGLGALAITATGSQFVRSWLIGDGAWTGGAMNGRVLAFTMAVALLTGLITSLVPALQTSTPNLAGALSAGHRSGSVQHSRTRGILLVIQAAVAVVLLSGAGLFIQSLRNASSLDLGIDTDHVLVGQVDPAVTGLSNEESRRLFDQFAVRARTIPGIAASAVTIALPFSMSWSTEVGIPGHESFAPRLGTVQYAVTNQYFAVLGIRTVLGRLFSASDRDGSAPVAIVNETMARRYWPGQSPVGVCVKVGGDSMPCATIVGVVTNTRRQDLVEGPVGQIYRPLDQLPRTITDGTVSFFGYTLVARSLGNASSMTEQLRKALQSVGPAVPYVQVQTMRSILGRQTRNWEVGARVFTAFGTLALLLAGIGLFSVVAFTIGQRMHEFGVRTALGAQRTDLLRLTLVRGVTPAVTGIIVGVGLSMATGRLMESLLFQESSRDPIVLGIASGTLLVCAVAASLVPAMHAANVDPTIALRAD